MRSEIDRFQIREIFQTVDRCDLRPRKLDRLYRFGFFLRNLTVLIRIEVRHDVGLQHLIGNHGRIGQFLARLLDYDMLRSICILEDNRRVTRATLRIRQHLERELLVDHSAGIHSLDVRLKFHRYILLRIGHRYRFRILVDNELPLLILLDFERGLLTATYEIECHLLGRICLIGRRNRKLLSPDSPSVLSASTQSALPSSVQDFELVTVTVSSPPLYENDKVFGLIEIDSEADI